MQSVSRRTETSQRKGPVDYLLVKSIMVSLQAFAICKTKESLRNRLPGGVRGEASGCPDTGLGGLNHGNVQHILQQFVIVITYEVIISRIHDGMYLRS